MKKMIPFALSCMLVIGMMQGCAANEAVQPTAEPEQSAEVAEVTPAPTEAPVPTEAPTPTEAPKPVYTAGIYTGNAAGNGGYLAVEVDVNDFEIVDVRITECVDTPIICDTAIEYIPQRILEAQSLDIDIVSGATLTSVGIMNAVADALEQAGADNSTIYKKYEKAAAEAKNVELSADVVVVGGGGAGLAAATAAVQGGASVVIVEKMPYVGGNTLVCGGIYNAAVEADLALAEMTDGAAGQVEAALAETAVNDVHAAVQKKVSEEYAAHKEAGNTALFDSPAWHALQTWNGGDKIGDLELIQVMCEQAPDTINWLTENGMEFQNVLTQGAGSLYRRTHVPVEKLGAGYINCYLDVLNNNDKVTFLLSAPADSLLVENGIVTGVTATGKDGSTYTITANKGVVLSTGGFSGNVEMRQEYCEGTKWPDLGTGLRSSNMPGITGDGIRMARDIGANLVDMEQIQLMHSVYSRTGRTSGGLTNQKKSIDGTIFVNQEGNRFVAEDERRDVLCNAIIPQTNSIMYIIHSHDNIEETPETIDFLVSGGTVFRADTVAELAEQIGVDAKNLQASIDQYNAAVEAGVDEVTGRTSLIKPIIDNGPYYAQPRVVVAHHTMGGVQINAQAQVISTEGEIIPGLYAAGEVTGDLHGGNRLGGNAVMDTVVFGRIAGTNAAK